ncbi:hypothetical protein LTR56_028062, partial [Elasticomyces elasticus]
MSVAQGVFLEMFLTAIFIMNILMLAAEKSKDTFIAPIGIGLTLFTCEIAGVFYTGASLNPAQSFGPCVAGRNFQSYHWIYWISGKSTLMKYAFAHAKKRKLEDDIILSFFFNAQGDDLEKTTLGMYRGLLFQLLNE